MKVSELVKHFEEGGEIQYGSNGRRFSLGGSFPNWTNVMSHPNEYKIVTPRKTVKLYGYLIRDYSKAQRDDEENKILMLHTNPNLGDKRVPKQDMTIEVED